jgi:hypothetical protein
MEQTIAIAEAQAVIDAQQVANPLINLVSKLE